MQYSIADIATALSAEFAGDGSLLISGAAEPGQARATDIAVAVSPKFADQIPQGSALAAILWPGADWQALGLKAAVFVGHGRFGMADLTRAFDRGFEVEEGVHESAVIAEDAVIGTGASIGPLCVVGSGAVLGEGCRVGAGVIIGRDVNIGANAIIHPGVRIAHDVTVGANFVAQSGAVIGSDGFSFAPPEGLDIEATRRSLGDKHDIWPGGPAEWRRVHSIGGVMIGDDVEVGANTTIDRGTIRATSIGRGTKLDNLVHIAHNVEVAEDSLICASVSIAGSTRIGSRCVLGGQVGINDNIVVGDDVIAAGATKIYTNVPSGRVVMGSPATKMQTQIETYKAMRRLPRLIQQVKDLQKRVSKLDETD